MPQGTRITLAQGLFRGDVFHRVADIAPLSGRAELDLLDASAGGQVAARVVDRLLANAVIRIGALSGLGPDDMAELTIGDRERLLFGLYRISFGHRLSLTVRCTACDEISEIDIAAEAAPPPEGGPSLLHEAEFRGGAFTYRLPTGGDQAALAAVALNDAEEAAVLLLWRCLERDAEPTHTPESEAALLAAFETALRATDPASDGLVRIACAACAAENEVLIDAAALLRGALSDGGGILFDVHRIARAYHWPERDILDLPTMRRRDYLALIEEVTA